MPDSNRSAQPPLLAALAPLALFVGGLFIAWCVAVLWLRQVQGADIWVRQTVPLLLWTGAIAFWILWQRPSRPAAWLGLLPVGAKALAIAVAAFAAVFAWHAIRVALGRMPGGLLGQLPVEIYAWMFAGIVLNELMFRGIVQTRLTEVIGPRAGIVLAAAAALAFRVPSFYLGGSQPIEPVMLSTILLLSLLAGVLRHLSGSLWPAIALAAGNALGTLL